MQSGHKLLVLADDLTGAADSAARCRYAGLPATIFLRPPQPPLPPGAVAFTSDSRHLPPAKAAQRVRRVVADLHHIREAVWYKKIDSTLRGNMGTELEALLALQASTPCAVISPGFPAQGRGLREGRLVMEGQETAATHLPTLLRAQTELALAVVDLERVRSGVPQVADHLHRARSRGARLLVVDALSDEDLQVVLAAVQRAMPDALLCGSAGLVGILAQRMAAADPSAHPAADTRQPVTRVLTVVGSGSVMAHRQLDALGKLAGVYLAQTEPGREPAIPAGCRKCALYLPPPPADALLDGPHARQLANHLAETAARVLGQIQPERLILVGGDTAIATLEKLGIRQLRVQHELLPGMPLTVGVDRTGCERQVVLKAGNHGDEQTLATLMHAPQGNRER
jgi:uncharacterized protein YgbK (DUF1537 family)